MRDRTAAGRKVELPAKRRRQVKVHWEPMEPVSWPSSKSNPRMRTFLLPGNVACHGDGLGSANTLEVTCKRCLRLIGIARIDTPANPGDGALEGGGQVQWSC